MDAKIWIAAAIGLLIILGVIAYNMYQENQYRRQVREQFGHADKDALLESQTESVRDGKTHGVAAPQASRANRWLSSARQTSPAKMPRLRLQPKRK